MTEMDITTPEPEFISVEWFLFPTDISSPTIITQIDYQFTGNEKILKKLYDTLYLNCFSVGSNSHLKCIFKHNPSHHFRVNDRLTSIMMREFKRSKFITYKHKQFKGILSMNPKVLSYIEKTPKSLQSPDIEITDLFQFGDWN